MTRAHPMTRKRRWLTRAALGSSLAVIGFFTWVIAIPFPEEALSRDALTSTVVLDRSGGVLRELLSSEATRGRWVPLEAISPNLRLAIVHAEDRRFFDHAGSDFPAMVRALWLAAEHGELRSGASTITQQTVKLTLQRGATRSLGTKLMEIVWAWRLELARSKEAILEQYLNRAPFGNQLVGVEAASRMYLGKPASQLSVAEAAFLAGLPNSPTRLNPYKHLDRALARQRWLLDLMYEREAIDELTWRTARVEPLLLLPRRGALEAPHLTTRAGALLAPLSPELRPATIESTIDASLQRELERLIAAQRPPDARGGAFQAAAVVLDTRTSEVLAWVGSRDFFDRSALGENDGVAALRQPGSALKPFVYAALFEAGAPFDTMLDDEPTSFATPDGPYRPENFDRSFHGRVAVRTALGSSLNVPAVAALERVGVPRVLTLLRTLGLRTLTEPPDHYGLGLALGNGEVRLVDLAGAYATLGRLGLHLPVRWLRGDSPVAIPLLSEETCFVLLDMLADDRARGMGFGLAGPFELPYRIAAKTGTSSDYRDNVAVAVTPLHTVAIWVGNFDGRPMQRRPGRSGAAPLLRQVVQLLYPEAASRGAVPWFDAPTSLVRRGDEWARR